jgi:hypothetical protein
MLQTFHLDCVVGSAMDEDCRNSPFWKGQSSRIIDSKLQLDTRVYGVHADMIASSIDSHTCPTLALISCCIFVHLVTFTVAAGQVMARLQLPWTGRPSPDGRRVHGSFQILLIATIAFWVVNWILSRIIVHDTFQHLDGTTGFTVLMVIHDVWRYAFFFLTFWWLWNLRRTVRAKSAIPVRSMYEDAVCSLCCPCLVAGQLLRHTTDYDVYPSACCSERGIPQTAPYVV